MHPELSSELALIQRAVQPLQFRFLVVVFNHESLIQRLQDHLYAAYPDREWLELDVRFSEEDVLIRSLKNPPAGFLVFRHAEALLSNGGLVRSINQRRDQLSRHDFALLMLVSREEGLLPRFTQAMPDMWSLRNLVAELYIDTTPNNAERSPFEAGYEGSVGKNEMEALRELTLIEARLNELLSQNSGPLTWALILRLARIYLRQGKYQSAQHALEKVLNLAESAHDQAIMAEAGTELGEVFAKLGKLDKAQQTLTLALELSQKAGKEATQSAALNNLSQVLRRKGDLKTAKQYLEQSLEIKRKINDRPGQGTALNNLAGIARSEGSLQTALDLLTQSLTIRREVGDTYGEGVTLNNLAQVYEDLGDLAAALPLLKESLAIRRKLGDLHGLATTLNNIGAFLLNHTPSPESAFPYLYEAFTLRGEANLPEKTDTAVFLDTLRSKIGDTRYQQLESDFIKGGQPSQGDNQSIR